MKVLITGITGTLGQAVCKQLLADQWEVVGYSRDEFKQAQMEKHENLTLYLGDVRDRDRLIEASRQCTKIFHFAALKHVDQLEYNPEEAISTNVHGTENVLHAQRVNKIEKVILSSTDKACLPINAYGMSKALAERLVLRNPFNIVCRYGNVLASRGSVIATFVKSIIDHNVVNITDPAMTRFWITIDQASNFVIQCSQDQYGLCIPPIKAAPLMKVAETIATILEKTPKYKAIQMRPGEKLHETLEFIGAEPTINSEWATQYAENELFDLLMPIVRSLT